MKRLRSAKNPPTNTVPRWTAWVIAGWLATQWALPVQAQSIQLLDPAAKIWSYDASGVDRGTGWRQPGYDDTAWAGGKGLFGSESTFYPNPITTPVPAPTQSGPITAYYRAHFNWLGDPSRVTLSLTAYVDDGCVIYLNGLELARFNMSASPVAFSSLADASDPGGEPVVMRLTLAAPNLVQGDNLIAVEVHQSSDFSPDHVFGLELLGQTSTPFIPIITAQPKNVSVRPGRNAVFTVAAGGATPMRYQWRFNGADLPLETNPTLILPGVSESAEGQYSVTVSNDLGSRSSAAATLTVDATLPAAVYSMADDFALGSNPNGVWSYGSKVILGGAFTPLGHGRVDAGPDGVANHAWEFTPGTYPAVLYNPTTMTGHSNGGQGVYPPGTVWFFPGDDGTDRNFGVIRFTVPLGQGGVYTIKSAVRSYLDGSLSRDSEYHVVVNGSEVLGQFIAPRSGATYTNSMMLNPGDTVDFLVGRGQDGSQIASALKIEAAIAANAPGQGLPPAILQHPFSTFVNPGGTATFSVVAEGEPPLSYQWHFRSMPLPGATGSALTIGDARKVNEGNYTVVVGNGNGFAASNPAILAINDIGTKLVVPAGFEGQNGQYGGVPTLAHPLRVQQVYGAPMFPQKPIFIHEIRWRPALSTGYAFDTTVADIQFNLSTTLAQPNALSTTFANNLGPNDTVVFNGPLHISSNFSGPAGEPKAFDIVLTLATPFLYDPAAGNLLVDMRNRSGSTAPFLDISGSPSDNASRAIALNSGALTASTLDTGADIIQLVYTSADGPPIILKHPKNTTVQSGQTAFLTVEARGGLPLTYQWKFNGDELPGPTTGPTLTLAGVVPSQAGVYAVEVANASAILLSLPATLSVTEAGNAWVLPPSRAFQNGSGGTQSLTSAMRVQQIYAGSLFPARPIVIHQLRWRPHYTLGSAFDTTVANLQINLSTSSADSNQLSAVFAANVGPNDAMVFQGPIHLSSAVIGPSQGPMEFDIIIPLQTPFLYDPTEGALLVDMRNFTPSQVTTLDGTGFDADGASRAIAFNVDQPTASAVDSSADIIQVIYNPPSSPPSIVEHPQNAIVLAHTPTSLSVTAIGDPPLSYQWRHNGTDIEGAAGSVLALENPGVDDSDSYSVRVSNGFGSVLSLEAQLLVQAGPLDSWAYVLDNGFEETPTTFSIGSGQLFSGWRVEAGNVDVLTHSSGFLGLSHSGLNAIDLNGQAAGTISTNITTVAGSTYLLEFAFSKNPEASSPAAEVMLNNAKLLDFQFTQPNSPSWLNWQTTSVVFTVASPATKLTFRSLSPGAGGVYLDTIRMRPWRPAPHIVTQPQGQTTVAGLNVTLQVESGGSPPLAYEWLFNGAAIDGANSGQLVLNNVQAGQAGLYSVRVSNGFGTVLSQEAQLIVVQGGPNPPGYLLNNGFEETAAFATFTTGQIFSGWRVDQGQVDVLGYHQGIDTPSHSGSNTIDLNGTISGIISTNLSTLAGQTYTLAFAFSKNPAIISASAEVLIDNAKLLEFTRNLPNSASVLNWQTTSVVFTATSDATKLAFRSLTSGSAGVYLDTIQVSRWPQAPMILIPPRTQAVALGGTVLFEIQAGGDLPLSFQWLFNGAELPGETQRTLTLVNLQYDNQGEYTVRVVNWLGSVTSAPAVLTVLEAPGILTQPQDLAVGENENALFQVTATGGEPLAYQWFRNGTAIPGATSASLVLTHAPLTAAGNYTVTVSNPVGSATSESATLTVNPDLGRAVLIPHTNSTLGASVTLPVFLLADGDENGVGFSVNFDASRLNLLAVVLGPDATGAFLNLNDSQAGAGRVGMNLALPFGQTFPEGTQAVVSISFAVSRDFGAFLAPLTFGDSPIVREVSGIEAETLQTLFVNGSIRVSGGLEADVSPGQDGNNQVTITDWVKVGRFAAGLDVPPNATHFQRADCAPRSTLGNGILSVSDWVQAGRYAAVLDPWAGAGGPASSGTGGGALLAAAAQEAGGRDVQVMPTQAEPGQSLSLPIQLESSGNENAVGFSLSYDPAKLRFLGASLGADAAGASFNVNSNQQAGGSLGLALSLPVGGKFAAGTRKAALVRFAATSNAAGEVAVEFADEPVLREISDPLANVLAAAYSGGTVSVAPVLHIRLSPEGLVLSWPAAAGPFILESRDPAGGSDSWTEVDAEKVVAGDELRVDVPAAEASRFYRLRKP